VRARVAVAALVGLAGLACASPTPSALLPEQPLVFVHRTLAQGRDRADWLKKRRGESESQGQGVLKLNELDDMIARVRGIHTRMSPQLEGQIALYHPREERVELLDAFLPGAVPCDWSPDHTRLLVASRRGGAPQLFEYSTERRDIGVAVFDSDRAVQLSGSYGPNGRLVYEDARRVGPRLVLSLRTTRPGGVDEDLTPGPNDLDPRWSPDGSTVIFESRLPGGSPLIEAIDVRDELAEPRVIARGREARFSPRGDWVVFSRKRHEGWRLWRMRPDGTGKTAIGHAVQGTADERFPTVSPDGNYVAYVGEQDDREQIRIRGMDGSGDRLLIDGADGTLPVW
jgi:Tol biopolymer transport system component